MVSLVDFFKGNENALNDGSWIFSGSALFREEKAKKKLKNAIDSYANNGGDPSWDEPLVLVDSTVFGSASDGIFIGASEIHAKGFMEEPVHFRVSEITSFWIDVNERKININGKAVSYFHSELTPYMEVIKKIIGAYIEAVKDEGVLKKYQYELRLRAHLENYGVEIGSYINEHISGEKTEDSFHAFSNSLMSKIFTRSSSDRKAHQSIEHRLQKEIDKRFEESLVMTEIFQEITMLEIDLKEIEIAKSRINIAKALYKEAIDETGGE